MNGHFSRAQERKMGYGGMVSDFELHNEIKYHYFISNACQHTQSCTLRFKYWVSIEVGLVMTATLGSRWPWKRLYGFRIAAARLPSRILESCLYQTFTTGLYYSSQRYLVMSQFGLLATSTRTDQEKIYTHQYRDPKSARYDQELCHSVSRSIFEEHLLIYLASLQF
jgi:hypothetical protein